MARYWPLRAGSYVLSSPFGPRWGDMHRGQDFAADDGIPIYAAADGTVEYIGPAQGFGQWIVLRHNDSQSSVYGHMWDAFAEGLDEGDTVRGGQHIANVGSNGQSDGPHLHFEIHPGEWAQGSQIDPIPWLKDAEQPGGPVAPRPDFNEYPVWSQNHQSRNGIKPDLFIIHTQEGNGNADSLARWLGGNVSASYHYTISEDPNDHGVTVCDVVDTDRASWSVLSANNRSINLCFAGSSAVWSREQWMRQSRAIDVAAYLAVQDCQKYGIPAKVIPPPYGPPGGITDHAYVTRYLHDGTHTDVGANFPWDYFASRVAYWANPTPAPQPPTPLAPPAPLTDRQLLERIAAKLGVL